MGEAKRKRKAHGELLLGVSLHSVDGLAADLSNDGQVVLAGVTIQSPGIGQAIRKVFAEQVCGILDRHGPAAFVNTKHAAAIHEAGHAVVHTVEGIRVKHVRIEQHRAGSWLGFTDTFDGGFSMRPNAAAVGQILSQARNLCAGVLAEQMFDADFREGSSLDEVIASQLFGAQAALLLKIDDEAQHWHDEVWQRTFASLRFHKDIVREIAEHLFAHHTLCDEPLEEFCKKVREHEGAAT